MGYPSAAYLGQATLLKQEKVYLSGNFTTIAEVRDIKGPNESRALVEVTNNDSTNDYREWISGLIDPGSLDFTANNIPGDTSQDDSDGFYAAFHQGLRRNYTVTPRGSHGTYSLLGLALKHEKLFPLEKQAEFNGSIKITGPVSWAA